MAVLKYRDPISGAWSEIGVSGVTDHGDLTGLTEDHHPQYLMKAGGSMIGPLIVVEATSDFEPVQKKYVDDRLGVYVQPENPGDPTSVPPPTGTRSQLWVDTDDGTVGSDFLPIAGGTITGSLVVNGMFTTASASSTVNGHRKIFISVYTPQEAGVAGVDGDIWFQRET